MRPDQYSFWIRKQRYSFSKYAPNKNKKKNILEAFYNILVSEKEIISVKKSVYRTPKHPHVSGISDALSRWRSVEWCVKRTFWLLHAPFSLHCCACNEGLLSVVSLLMLCSLVMFCNDFCITISHEVQKKWASQREKSRQKQMAI